MKPDGKGKKMTDETVKEFEILVKPIVDWANINGDPHTVIVIKQGSAEVYTGSFGTVFDVPD